MGATQDLAKRKEIGRRVRGVRYMRGLSRAEVGKRLKADGLGKQDPKRIEEGAIDIQRKHLDALARHLEVPATLFLAPEQALRWPADDELDRMFRDFWRDSRAAEPKADESDRPEAP